MKAWRGRWVGQLPSSRFLACAALALALTSCATPVSEHFYRLGGSVEAIAVDSPASDYQGDVRIVLAAIPEEIDRPQLALLRGSNEMVVLESERWAEPVRSGIVRALTEYLGHALPRAWVVSDGPARTGKTATVFVYIDAMDASTTGEVRLDARWLVRTGADLAAGSDRIALRSRTGSAPADAVAAWNGHINMLAHAIATTLRRLPSQP